MRIYKSLVIAIILSLGVGLFYHYSPAESARADEPPRKWLDAGAEPSLEKSWSITSHKFSGSIKQGYNPKCTYIELMKNNFLPDRALHRQTVNGCWYDTSIGLLAKYDNYLAAGLFIAGNIKNIGIYGDGIGANLEPTPRSDTFLERSNSEIPSRRYLKYHFGATVDTSYSLISSATHTLNSKDTFILKTDKGYNLDPEIGGINYSGSGRYVVGATAGALFRVDLETKQILNFGEPIKKGPGWNPYMRVSITNDGQYAVATGTAQAGGQWMRVYDLTQCDGVEQPTLSSTHANCDYRDLTGFIKQNIPSFDRFTMAEFIDEDTIIFYHIQGEETQTHTRYFMRAPHAGPRTRSYIAMGDSFASGEGAYAYFKGTDEGEDLNNCHLSKRSYPYLIGDWLSFNSYHSVACSGAVTRNIKGPGPLLRDLVKEDRGNQYLVDIENNELDKWMPGFWLQKEFLKEHTPDVATVSIIGNDLGFGDKIKRCLEPDTCYNTYEDRVELLREVRGKFSTLVETYQKLQESSPRTKFYAIGYPEIGNPGGDCAVNVRLDQDELEFAQSYVDQLNQIIELAANHTGVFYVDVSDALSGSRFCEDKGSALAINGLTVGNDIASVIGKESYHPNARGHELLARKIIERTDDFNQPAPPPDSSIKPPSEEDDLLFLNKPRSGRKLYLVNYDKDIANNIVFRDRKWEITRQSFQFSFRPTSLVNVMLNSDPVSLGSFKADGLGNLKAIVSIPSSVPTGFHTLHLYGINFSGEPIDIYRVVYVASTETDKDGDGTLDAEQACGVFDASNQDSDYDGVDDSCDAVIELTTKEETSEENEDAVSDNVPNESNVLSEKTGNESIPSDDTDTTATTGVAFAETTQTLANTHGQAGSPLLRESDPPEASSNVPIREISDGKTLADTVMRTTGPTRRSSLSLPLAVSILLVFWLAFWQYLRYSRRQS